MAATAPEPSRAAKVMPVPSLRFTSGPAAGVTLRLEHEEGTLGRRDDNHYVIADPGVSRVHARITRTGETTILVTDLGSSGGTTVNDESVTGSCTLVHGDRLGVGTSEAVLENPVAAAATSDETTTMMLKVPEPEDAGPGLSPRQTEVLQLIAEGMTNSEIGDQLGITERTVKAYAQELYTKLGVRNRAGAVAEAINAGIL